MLTRIEIDNYKSISHADLNFSRENIIVGPNGVGKSNLLDAIHFVRDAVTDGMDHAVTARHGINSIRRWSKTRPYNISIKFHLSVGEEQGTYRVVIASAGGEFSILEEEGTWRGSDPLRGPKREAKTKLYRYIRKGSEPLEFEIPDNPFPASSFAMTVAEADIAITQLGVRSTSAYSFFFGSLYRELASCGAYSIYPNKIREPQKISNSEVLFDDGTNLASIIRQMRSTTFRSNRESLTAAIKLVLPILSEIRIESAGGYFVPVFRVRDNDDGHLHDLNMSQISDGTLRMLGMLTAFYQPRAPKRITLEEPEQMIHPGLLPILIDSSRDYLDDSKLDRQTFFTTHSPNLLDLFDCDSIISTDFQGGLTRFAKLSNRQIKIIKERLFTAGELLVAEGLFE